MIARAAGRRRATRTWDLFAVGLSSTCILHCLGLPVLSVLLPMTTLAGDSHLLHLLMVLLATPITLWVVSHEPLAEVGWSFTVVALAGLTLLLVAVFVPSLEAYEVFLTLVGGTLLGGAHIWRFVRHQTSRPVRMATGDDDR